MSRQVDNDRLPAKVIAYVVIVVVAELNFLRSGGPIVAEAGKDGWLSILLAGAGLALSVWVIVSLMRAFPGKSLVEIAQSTVGRFLGTGIVLIYVIYWIFRSGVVVHVQSHLFSRQLLPETPEFYLSLYMVILSCYLVRHGFEPMARLFWVFVFVYALSVAPLALLGTGLMDFGRLKPVLYEGIGPALRGAWVAYIAAPGMAVLLMINPVIPDLRGAMRSALKGVMLLAIPAAILNIFLVGTFGAEDVATMQWSTMVFVETIEVPGFDGFRLDPIFLTAWCLMIFGTVAMLQYSAVSALRRIFGAEDNLLLVLATGGLIMAFALVPNSPPDLIHWTDRVSAFVVPPIILGFPAFLWSVAKVRRRGVTRNRGGAT